MTTRGINHINLRAPRALLDKLKFFYCEVIGLHVGSRPPFSSFGYWLYAGDQAILHLSQALPDENQATHIRTTLDHVALDCSDRFDVEGTLKRHGVPYRTALVPATNQVQLFLEDPAGNRIELNFADGAA
jgi:catechol-2,3-dioxygenase